MAKVYTYLVILTGISLLLTLVGAPTTTNHILGVIGGTPEGLANFNSSTFVTTILALIALLAGVAAVYIGIFGRNISALPLAATLAATLAVFIGDFVSIVTYVQETWARWILYLMMGPLLIGYVIALFDWVRGID